MRASVGAEGMKRRSTTKAVMMRHFRFKERKTLCGMVKQGSHEDLNHQERDEGIYTVLVLC